MHVRIRLGLCIRSVLIGMLYICIMSSSSDILMAVFLNWLFVCLYLACVVYNCIYIQTHYYHRYCYFTSFIRTNQTSFLSAQTAELPDILKGIQSICAIESTLLGNVSVDDGEASSSTAAVEPTGISASAAYHSYKNDLGAITGMTLLLSVVGAFSLVFV